jgi:hypothetical protein
MIAVLSTGERIASAWPVCGLAAPMTQAYSYSVCRTAVGREPRWAHNRVNVPC